MYHNSCDPLLNSSMLAVYASLSVNLTIASTLGLGVVSVEGNLNSNNLFFINLIYFSILSLTYITHLSAEINF